MRNLKRALSLALASVMVLGLMVVGSGASYKDVSSEQNLEAIEVLQEVGIMVGDDNGNFNPDQKVTRNEMAVVMSNLMDYRVASYAGTSPFTDVPAWAEPYVAACWTNGITKGYTATTYGGSDTVTTAQAALMLMKALGYFQYESDFEDDWQLATVKQANKIDLFDDVDSGVQEAMTRNDVAQLVLNTLEAGTVEADDDTIKVETGDTKVEAGKVKYNYVTSSKDYADAISDAWPTSSTNSTSGYIVELGEKLYNGDLTKTEDYDDFGRPANVWEYQAKQIGKYADDADYTFTAKVTPKALYNAIGKTATDYDDWSVSLNGETIAYTGADLVATKTDDDTDFVAAATKGSAATDNGTLTQVYVDGTDKTVDIAIIEYYAAEVLKVDEAEGTITLSDLTGNANYARTTDTFDTTDFEEDDIVVYSYANDEIQEVYAADKLEGEVTQVRTKTSNGKEVGDNFVVDGTTYKYNKTTTKDRLTTDNVDNDVVAYLDQYGYVMYIDESAITYDYAYVLSMGTDDDMYGADSSSSKGSTVYARLVLSDGTMIKVETDNKKAEIGTVNSSGKYVAADSTSSQNYLLNHIVSYSVDKDDVYTLKDRSGKAIADASNATTGLKIENGVSSFRAENGSRYSANSNTIFIVADPDDDSFDDYDFTVYTGVKNVPDIDYSANSKAVVATETGSSVAKVVYIEDADTSGDEVIFIRADKAAKLVKNSVIGNYYEINAFVDGAKTTLKVKESSTTAVNALITSIDTSKALKISDTKYIVAAKSITTNSDDLVTSVRLYDAYSTSTGDGSFTGKETVKAEKDTVGLKNNTTGTSVTGFAWDDEVVVLRYNENNKGEFASYRISSIKDDTNDTYIAVTDGDVLTGLCVIDVPDGTVETPDEPEEPVAPEGVSVKIVGANIYTVGTTDPIEESDAITVALKAKGYDSMSFTFGSDGRVEKVDATKNGGTVTYKVNDDTTNTVLVSNSDELQAAVNGTNTTIYLTEGTYELGETVDANLTIIGDGSTVLKTKTPVSGDNAGIHVSGSANLTVKGVTFKANGTATRGIATAPGYTGKITIEDCTFEGLTTGIFLNNLQVASSVKNCTFKNCTAGIGIDGLTADLTVESCTFSGNGEDIGAATTEIANHVKLVKTTATIKDYTPAP